MADGTGIEWCDATFNPWIGCTKVSPACDHCYAERWGARFGVEWGNHPRRATSDANWRQPRRWDRDAKAAGVRRRVFCASLADAFDNQVPPAWRTQLWQLIHDCDGIDWLLLTKRPQNIAGMLPGAAQADPLDTPDHYDRPWPWPHVWLGTTAENQEEADRRIPALLAVPAAMRFISAEPLLGPVDLRMGLGPGKRLSRGDEALWLDWVIAGGESGPNARPMHPDWPRKIRDDCAAAGVPFFFKQWGEWGDDRGPGIDGHDPIFEGRAKCAWLDRSTWRFEESGYCVDLDAAKGSGDWVYRIGKKAAGRLLDGREHSEFPA